MMDKNYYIEINKINIPINIRSYKRSRNINIYFKNNILNVSKPKYVSNKKALDVINENKAKIYDMYIKSKAISNERTKKWETGEKILYRGEFYSIIRKEERTNKCSVNIDEENKQFVIIAPCDLGNKEIKINIDKLVKNIFKNNTCYILQERLPILSNITNIEYNSFKVRDATTRYGSCYPLKKELHFSLRLVMLSQEKIDAIIVHELCHIVYKNHNKEFYNLVKKYIPNYDDINKWLKENGHLILF